MAERGEELRKLRLVHYSAQPLTALKPVKAAAQSHGMKPRGLWLSVENDPETSWRGWCEAESFAPDRLAVVTPFSIAQWANILHLCGAADIDAFTAAHRVDERWPRTRSVDWPEVARRYDGIVIAPYVWERRLDGDAGWYYGWDCASGCVWNTDILLSQEENANAA